MDRSAALLAGVCSRLARLLRCNVWVLRAGFILLLMVKSLLALVVYVVLAVLFALFDRVLLPGRGRQKDFSLESPKFAAHDRRIRELDRRFREWENSQGL